MHTTPAKDPLPHLIIIGLMLVLFLATFCSRHVQRHVMPVLAFTCCTLAVLYCYIMVDNVQSWAWPARQRFKL